MNIPNNKILVCIEAVCRNRRYGDMYSEGLGYIVAWLKRNHITDYSWIVNPTDDTNIEDITDEFMFSTLTNIGKDPFSHPTWFPAGLLLNQEDALMFTLALGGVAKNKI